MSDITELLHGPASVHCKVIIIGQYRPPTRNHWLVMKYYEPDAFGAIRGMAYDMGFKYVASGPLAHSSYHAAKMMSQIKGNL